MMRSNHRSSQSEHVVALDLYQDEERSFGSQVPTALTVQWHLLQGAAIPEYHGFSDQSAIPVVLRR